MKVKHEGELSIKGEAIHKKRLFLHLKWDRNTLKYEIFYLKERKVNFIFLLEQSKIRKSGKSRRNGIPVYTIGKLFFG